MRRVKDGTLGMALRAAIVKSGRQIAVSKARQ